MEFTRILEQNRLALPAAIIDLDCFDQNVQTIARLVDGTSLKIRVATKSLRVPELIRRVLNKSSAFQGLMCYSAQEAEFLSQQGFDDFLIAYPTVDSNDLASLSRIHTSGKRVVVVVDHEEHLKALDAVVSSNSKKFSVIVEVDSSIRIGPFVIGVRRSPVRAPDDVAKLIQKINQSRNLAFGGLMVYEAHVAGVTDSNPFKPFLSFLLKPLRKLFAMKVRKQRKRLFEELRKRNINIPLFNGGGTGSLTFNREEASTLTELTAGSAFYCPHLFDYYSNLNLQPAAYFALQISRIPENGWVTCQGGGYVASGEPSWDRIPLPVGDYKFSALEATGEVQTPLKTSRSHKIGDAVLFRHSKAGEMFERFNEAVLIEGNAIKGRVKSYRGFGLSFF
jgi:D-serine deaminase-like pyridoxal phosphate-dependent protein